MTNPRIRRTIEHSLDPCSCRATETGAVERCMTHRVLEAVDVLDGEGWLRARPIPAAATERNGYPPTPETASVPALLRILATALTNEQWIGPRASDVTLLESAASMVEAGETVPAEPPAPQQVDAVLWTEPRPDRRQYHHPNITAEGYLNGEYEAPAEGNADLMRPLASRPANLVSSLTTMGAHRPAIDIDQRVEVVASRTPGHFHLYFPDTLVPWESYERLLSALVECGLVEQSYYDHSVTRGQTCLRMPRAAVRGARGHFVSPSTIDSQGHTVRSEAPVEADQWHAVYEPATLAEREADDDPMPDGEVVSATSWLRRLIGGGVPLGDGIEASPMVESLHRAGRRVMDDARVATAVNSGALRTGVETGDRRITLTMPDGNGVLSIPESPGLPRTTQELADRLHRTRDRMFPRPTVGSVDFGRAESSSDETL